jgi:toxin ParE1/3/4
MKGIGFDPDARAEFLAAIAYYEECGKGLGHRFRDTVEIKLDHIRQMPLHYQVLHPPFRRCLVPKFPYAIIFSIEPDFILVLAVAHTKRKPGYWLERLETHP